jgi:hypothetical protein
MEGSSDPTYRLNLKEIMNLNILGNNDKPKPVTLAGGGASGAASNHTNSKLYFAPFEQED